MHPAGGAHKYRAESGCLSGLLKARVSARQAHSLVFLLCAARGTAALPQGHCWRSLARRRAAPYCGVPWHTDQGRDVAGGGPPQVCRTYNYGEQGSSRGQFYRRYLQPIRLNDADIAWEGADLSYLDKRRRAARRALDAPGAYPPACLIPGGDPPAASIDGFAARRAEAAKPQAYALAGSNLRQAPSVGDCALAGPNLRQAPSA